VLHPITLLRQHALTGRAARRRFLLLPASLQSWEKPSRSPHEVTVLVAKALDQLLFLDPRSKGKKRQGDNSNQQNKPVGRGQADAQDGSGTDNANFSTPPDGSPGRMQISKLRPSSPKS
jgi:hypothetical protein